MQTRHGYCGGVVGTTAERRRDPIVDGTEDPVHRSRGDPTADCRCTPTVAETPSGDRLVLDATDCPGAGRLAEAPGCLATVVEALTDRDVTAVVTRTADVRREYADDSAALLVAAGRFASAVRPHDDALADLALADPLAAASAATGRPDPSSRLAAETGIAELAARPDGYDEALRPTTGAVTGRPRFAGSAPGNAPLGPVSELARTIDSVAASACPTSARHPLDADAVRVDRLRVGLRANDETAHVPITASGAVAALGHEPLRAVLRGRPPVAVFADPAALAAALAEGQSRGWQPAPDRLCVRRIAWEGVDATLVGACDAEYERVV